MQTESYSMTAQEHATVLAALRYYQQPGLADEPQKRPGAIHDIATGGDSATNAAAMNSADIDPLGERLNAPRKVEADSIARVLTAREGIHRAGQLNAPNGRRIIATKDWLPGDALIDGATRHPDGALELGWTGDTQICRDGQSTEMSRGRGSSLTRRATNGASTGSLWTKRRRAEP